MGEIETKKVSWNEFWGIIITLLGTYFASYTIAKDYGEIVILGRKPHDVFIRLLGMSIIVWFIFMVILIIFGYFGFKIISWWKSTKDEHR